MYHRIQKLSLMLHPLDPFCIWLLAASSSNIVKLLGVYLGSEKLCISGVLLKYCFCVTNFFTADYKLAAKEKSYYQTGHLHSYMDYGSHFKCYGRCVLLRRSNKGKSWIDLTMMKRVVDR
jgi:hypothetical protein